MKLKTENLKSAEAALHHIEQICTGIESDARSLADELAAHDADAIQSVGDSAASTAWRTKRAELLAQQSAIEVQRAAAKRARDDAQRAVQAAREAVQAAELRALMAEFERRRPDLDRAVRVLVSVWKLHCQIHGQYAAAADDMAEWLFSTNRGLYSLPKLLDGAE